MRAYFQHSLNPMQLLRFVSLLLTIVAVVTLCLWVWNRPLLDRIDNRISLAHTERITSNIQHVNQLYVDKHYQEAADAAESYLKGMSRIGKNHKHYGAKRKMLQNLIQSKVALGSDHASEALPYAKAWVDADRRDIGALRSYILVLRQLPDHQAELKEAISLFEQRFPGRPLTKQRRRRQ